MNKYIKIKLNKTKRYQVTIKFTLIRVNQQCQPASKVVLSFFGRCFSRHGHLHLSPGQLLPFYNALCQSQLATNVSFVPLHYINTCCRCDLQSAAENATNTRVPSSPAPVDAGKVLGRAVSANAKKSQDSSIKILKAIYLNVKLFKPLFLFVIQRC